MYHLSNSTQTKYTKYHIYTKTQCQDIIKYHLLKLSLMSQQSQQSQYIQVYGKWNVKIYNEIYQETNEHKEHLKHLLFNLHSIKTKSNL